MFVFGLLQSVFLQPFFDGVKYLSSSILCFFKENKSDNSEEGTERKKLSHRGALLLKRELFEHIGNYWDFF